MEELKEDNRGHKNGDKEGNSQETKMGSIEQSKGEERKVDGRNDGGIVEQRKEGEMTNV